MDACMIPGGSANPAVFLVELRATHASSLEIRGMHLAVTPARRHRRPGPVAERTTIPERSRSLYFIAAADRLAGAAPTRRDRPDTPPVPAAAH